MSDHSPAPDRPNQDFPEDERDLIFSKVEPSSMSAQQDEAPRRRRRKRTPPATISREQFVQPPSPPTVSAKEAPERPLRPIIAAIAIGIAVLAGLLILSSSPGAPPTASSPVPSPADIFAGVDRTDAQALVRRGNELYLQNRFEDAVLLYTEALKANPNDGTAHNNLGNAYFRLQRIVEATEHYREAVRINGNDAEAHQNLGAALAAQGDIDGAIAQYERALALRPDLPEALYSIGYLSNEKYTAATDPAERERWKQRAVDNLKHFLAVAKPELSAEANEARRILATLGTP